MTTYQLAVIPGDGVGTEVIPEGLKVLRRAGEVTGSFDIATRDFPWSCQWYLEHGAMMPPDGVDQLARLGRHLPRRRRLPGRARPRLAVGPAAADPPGLRPVHQPAAGPAARRDPRPLRDRGPADVDILCIRENTEGEYVGLGGRFHQGRPEETALQTSLFTRRGVERIVRYAFDRAMERKHTLASATKSNALNYTAVFWDEVVDEVARDYPDVDRHALPRGRPGGADGHRPRHARCRSSPATSSATS